MQNKSLDNLTFGVMNVIDNYKSIMTTKYSRFYGRASRSEFWKFILANFILLLIIATPVSFLSSDIAFLIELIMALYLLVIFIPGMALSTRRLHDINRSGWWLLLYLIPYLGAIALFFMFDPVFGCFHGK